MWRMLIAAVLCLCAAVATGALGVWLLSRPQSNDYVRQVLRGVAPIQLAAAVMLAAGGAVALAAAQAAYRAGRGDRVRRRRDQYRRGGLLAERQGSRGISRENCRGGISREKCRGARSSGAAHRRLWWHLREAGAGRRILLHGRHSAANWLGFAVWEDGTVARRRINLRGAVSRIETCILHIGSGGGRRRDSCAAGREGQGEKSPQMTKQRTKNKSKA